MHLYIHRFAFWLLLANSVLRCAVETTWWGYYRHPHQVAFQQTHNYNTTQAKTKTQVQTVWWGILSPASSGSFSTYTQTKHNTSKDKNAKTKTQIQIQTVWWGILSPVHQMAFQRSSAQLHSEVEEVMSVLMDFQPGADDYLSDRGQIFEYTMHMSIRRWCHLIHSTRSLLQILKSCEEGENVRSRAGFSIWILFKH